MTTALPPDQIDGVLEEVDGAPVIRFVRHFDHPVADVWAAITQPDQLAQWWLPFDADIVVEPVAGGRFLMSARDGEFVLDCRVLRVEPPFLFEHTHVELGSVLRWELTPDGPDIDAAGCTLQLTQTVPSRETVIEKGFLVGLHHSLERLSAMLAGQPMDWDWDRLAVHQARYHQRGLAPAP